MPPWGSPAAAEIKGLGKGKAAGTVPAARVFFVDCFRKGYHLIRVMVLQFVNVF